MKIRTKLVSLSAALIITCGLGMLGMLAGLASTRFLEVEKNLARRDVARVVQAMDREIEALGTLTEDWAYWDDLWTYTQGLNPDFEQVNLLPSTYSNARLAFIAIYDARGLLCYGQQFETATGALRACTFLPRTMPLEGLPGFGHQRQGILRTPQGAMLTYAAAISRSDRSGTTGGMLVMGRVIDDGLLTLLGHQTGVAFTHAFLDPRAGLSLAPDAETPLLQVEERVLHGIHTFQTMAGEPVLEIRTTTERPIAGAMRSIAASTGASAVLLTILIGATTSLLFRRWVSQPLRRVERGLHALNLDDDRPQANRGFLDLPETADEMGRITRSLKDMYQRTRASHLRARQLNENLESEVAARTEALVKAHQRLVLYGKILQNTSEGMLITDADATILEVNDAMCRQSGFAREALIGQNPRVMKSSRHGQDFYQRMWSELLSTGYWSGELWNRKPDGEVYPKWLTINAIPGAPGKPPCYVGLSIDISAIKSAEERLHHLAYYDQLTGLPNRALFADRLRRTILRTQRKDLLSALLFLDLDRFKNINDTLGHTVGDALLVKVADRIRVRLRESDTVCRMGGDEFTVILAEIARLEDAGQVAAELIETLSKRFDIEGHEIYVGASIGIALCPRDGRDEETLIKKADMAMYAAKEAGRSTFCFASGELDASSRKRMEIEARLHGALERNELVLYFQPLTETHAAVPGSASGLVGAEALLRWIPEPGVVVGPGTFIPIAEDAGLIQAIGEWAIQEACRHAATWREQGFPLTVSVNVSARQFEDGTLPEVVQRALDAHALPASALRLEITESAFMRSMDKVVGIMDQLRHLGVLFSIDDFGTGFSSLQYIKCLPAQCLKIDKAFVSGVAANLSDAEIVSAIISMAKAFGLKSTAEGVETEDQLRELRERGCDEVQGYLMAKPMPAEDFLAFAAGRIPSGSTLATNDFP